MFTNFLGGYPGSAFFVFGNRVKVTHLDKSCAPYWNHKVFALGGEYCVHLDAHWAPLKTPKCLF
jgi:hypothetical protein